MALSFVIYTANGSTTDFSIPFSYVNSTDVKVYVDNVLDSSYTFVNASTIRTSTTPSAGAKVKVDRDTDDTVRAVDFQDGSVISEEQLDLNSNQIFNVVQENVDAIADTLKKDNTGVYDAGSVRIINVATPTSGNDATNKTYIDTQTTSAATSATNSATSATASAASAAAALVSKTAAETAKTAAELAETNAETAETNSETAQAASETAKTASETAKTAAELAETNAETAETNAETAEANSLTYKTAAETAKTAAETAKTAAETAKTAAETAETNAATSETNAAASYDSFDDRYLGAKSSNPSLDNDGNALLDGATFFDTTNNVFKVYDLGNTTWLQTIPSSSDQTNIDAAVSNASNINSAVSNATNINSAVSNAANINLVAGQISPTNNISTVASANSNISTVATNISGVNSFADRYRVGSSDPASSNDEGDLFYNDTSNSLKFYDGSSWNAITSDTDVKAGVSSNDTTPDYLLNKFTAGSNITLTETNDGGDETITIASTDNSVVMAIALGA